MKINGTVPKTGYLKSADLKSGEVYRLKEARGTAPKAHVGKLFIATFSAPDKPSHMDGAVCLENGLQFMGLMNLADGWEHVPNAVLCFEKE